MLPSVEPTVLTTELSGDSTPSVATFDRMGPWRSGWPTSEPIVLAADPIGARSLDEARDDRMLVKPFDVSLLDEISDTPLVRLERPGRDCA